MRKLQIEVADHVYEKLVRDAGQRNFTKHISQLILNYITEAREDTDVIASILARLDRLENLMEQRAEQEVLPTTSEPMVMPNTLSLDDRIAKAMKSGTDVDALVGQVAYEVGISTPEARKKVRGIKEQLNNV